MRKGIKRFTLVELLGVMVIISCISYYTIPHSTAVMQELTLKEFVGQVEEKVHIAQLKAKEEKSFYSVVFTENEYLIRNQETQKLVSVNDYPKNFNFHSSTYEGNEVTFGVDGSPSSYGEFLFRYSKNRKDVTILIESATGRVKGEW